MIEKNKDISLWLAEANFGLLNLRDYIKTLEVNSNILEVGCGSGILLSMLSEEFSQHKFIGIEPFGDGFSKLKSFKSRIRNNGINVKAKPYEKYNPKTKFNLIYSINVFEHLDDWRHFLYWAEKNLKKRGRCIILCPNYNFPYESHFGIPIIFNKQITYKIFKKYINKHEQKNDCHGLWKSLNFIKKTEIKNFFNQNRSNMKINLFDDLSIFDVMVERIFNDPEFKRRQLFLCYAVIFIKKIRILGLFKFFSSFVPYMKINLEKI